MRGVGIALAFALASVPYIASADAPDVRIRLTGAEGRAVQSALVEVLEARGHEVAVGAIGSDRASLRMTGTARRAAGAFVADVRYAAPGSRASRRLRMRGADPGELARRIADWLDGHVDGFTPEGEAAPAVAPEPPPEPEPEATLGDVPEPPEDPPAAVAAGASSEPARGPSLRSLIEVETSVGVLTRSLRYRDDLFDRVRGYRLRGAPTMVFGAHLYPFARTDLPFLRDLSIDAAAEYAIIADSRRPDGTSYPTQSAASSVGLGYRVPFGRHALLASFGYGVHSFLLEPGGPASPSNDPRPELPRVRYRTLRAGLGVRIAPVGGLVLHLSGAYLAVLDPGGIGTDVWFPRATVNGLELTGGVGYRLHRAVELRAMVDYRRYGFAMHPELGDPYIVGGAADQYVLYTLGLVVSH